MASGRQTLHDIDRAILQARHRINEAAELPARISSSLTDIQTRRAAAFGQIAKERLALIKSGGGGDLGYVDRQAKKLLSAHATAKSKLDQKIGKSLSTIEALEEQRRAQEKIVEDAVNAYDKKAADAEIKILKDKTYQGQLVRVEDAQSALARAEGKLSLSQEHAHKKTREYLKNPYFSYLQKRQFGTRRAKGWFLTKLLDRWIARLIDFDQRQADFTRFEELPQHLELHVKRQDRLLSTAKKQLETLESDILKNEGLTDLRKLSIAAQKKLDSLDQKIITAEEKHQALRAEQAELNNGEDGPMNDALRLLSETLAKQDVKSLRRLAEQTKTKDDDRAIEELRKLERMARELKDDQYDAKKLLKKYQKSLQELESVRRQYKRRRYDAPSSVISGGDLIAALLAQVVSGVSSGDDFWRQIQRAQRTVKRYSDFDFGGDDWAEGLRLPRNSDWRSSRSRRKTSRSPRRTLPRNKTAPRRKGGFKTGGGF